MWLCHWTAHPARLGGTQTYRLSQKWCSRRSRTERGNLECGGHAPYPTLLHNLVDRRRIELLPTRCKPVVLPLSLTAHYLVEIQGFEPRMPEATDLQSAEVTNASRSPNLVDAVRVELTQN
jgi:hypothetical protein